MLGWLGNWAPQFLLGVPFVQWSVSKVTQKRNSCKHQSILHHLYYPHNNVYSVFIIFSSIHCLV